MSKDLDKDTGVNRGSEPQGCRQSISMHDNIPVWYDCCSCEAEPYWQEAMAEMPHRDEKSRKKT